DARFLASVREERGKIALPPFSRFQREVLDRAKRNSGLTFIGAGDQAMRGDGRGRDLDGHVRAPCTLLHLTSVGIGANRQRLTGTSALGVVSNAGPAGGHFVRNVRLELVRVITA